MNNKYFNTFIFLLATAVLSTSAYSTQAYSTDTESPKTELLVHKSPTCGCCKEWIKHANSNGYTTTTQDHSNLDEIKEMYDIKPCLLYTSPSPRDQRGSRMPSSA